MISSFEGIRYRYRDLSKLICPPYDIISKEEEKILREKSKYNFVRIELPTSYICAKRTFERWVGEGVLKKDAAPSVYIYRQKFKLDKTYKRDGIICILEIAKDNILKHELTTEKPIEDRMRLISVLKAYTSPIFFVFRDDENNFSPILRNASKEEIASFSTDDGVSHILWRSDDEKFLLRVKEFISSVEIMIADGHHRYQASLDYFRKHGRGGYVLAYLCSSGETGLKILPTHRVVNFNAKLIEDVKRAFKVTGRKEKARMICYYQGRFLYLGGKKELPVVKLHSEILKYTPPGGIFYTHDSKEAIELAKKNNKIAFLLPQIKIGNIFSVVKKGKVLPPKSSYFYPKIPAGLVIHRFI